MLAFNAKNPFGYGRLIIQRNKVESVIEELNASPAIKKLTLCNSGVMLCRYELLTSVISNSFLFDVFFLYFQFMNTIFHQCF